MAGGLLPQYLLQPWVRKEAEERVQEAEKKRREVEEKLRREERLRKEAEERARPVCSFRAEGALTKVTHSGGSVLKITHFQIFRGPIKKNTFHPAP